MITREGLRNVRLNTWSAVFVAALFIIPIAGLIVGWVFRILHDRNLTPSQYLWDLPLTGVGIAIYIMFAKGVASAVEIEVKYGGPLRAKQTYRISENTPDGAELGPLEGVGNADITISTRVGFIYHGQLPRIKLTLTGPNIPPILQKLPRMIGERFDSEASLTVLADGPWSFNLVFRSTSPYDGRLIKGNATARITIALRSRNPTAHLPPSSALNGRADTLTTRT